MDDNYVCVVCNVKQIAGTDCIKFTDNTDMLSVHKKRIEEALDLEVFQRRLSDNCLCTDCEKKIEKIEELSEVKRSFKTQFLRSGIQANSDEVVNDENLKNECKLIVKSPDKNIINKRSKSIGTVISVRRLKKTDKSANKPPLKSQKLTRPAHNQTQAGFVCKLCGKSFKQSCKLEDHIGTEHRDLNLFECTLCKYNAGFAILVRSHYRRSHCNRTPKITNRLCSVPDWPKSKEFIEALGGVENLQQFLNKMTEINFATSHDDIVAIDEAQNDEKEQGLDSHDTVGEPVKQKYSNILNILRSKNVTSYVLRLTSSNATNETNSLDRIKVEEGGEIKVEEEGGKITVEEEGGEITVEEEGGEITVEEEGDEITVEEEGNEIGVEKEGSEAFEIGEQFKKPRNRKRSKMSKCYSCSDCTRTFYNDIDLEEHMSDHKNGLIMMCRFCNMGFKSHSGLTHHTKKQHAEFLHTCSECGKFFKGPGTLKTHMLLHGNTMSYACRYCDLRFPDIKARRVHYFTDHLQDTDKYPCPHCKRSFFTMRFLDLHMRKNHGAELDQHWKCSACDATFKHLFEYKKHCKSVHQDEGHKYRCETCKKTFLRKFNYDAHMESHQVTKTAECHLCQKSFKGKHQLNSHLHWHAEKKKYSEGCVYLCDECGKPFKSRHGLREHIRCHSVNESFKCDICDYVAPNQYRFRRHKKMVHETEPRYKCSVCEKTFIYKVSYNAHYNMHNDIRPYLCSECGRGFRTKCHLKEHMNAHSQKMTFICKHCGNSYLWRAQLLQHRKETHGEIGTKKPHNAKGEPRKRKRGSKKKVIKTITPVIKLAETDTLVAVSSAEQVQEEISKNSLIGETQTIVVQTQEPIMDQSTFESRITSPDLVSGFTDIKEPLLQNPLFHNLKALLQQQGGSTVWTAIPQSVTEVSDIQPVASKDNPSTESVTISVLPNTPFQTTSSGMVFSTVQEVTLAVAPPCSDHVVVTDLPNSISSPTVNPVEVREVQVYRSTFAVPITSELTIGTQVETVDTIQLVGGTQISLPASVTSPPNKDIVETTLATTQLLEICTNATDHPE